MFKTFALGSSISIARSATLVVALTALAQPQAVRAEPPVPGDALAPYLKTIKPLLAERCYSCHGGLAQEAGLRLDTVGLMEQGGDSGAAIARGKPAESLMLARVTDADPATRMPPEGEGEPLTKQQLATIEAWLAAGAPAPENEQPEEDPRQHWAFQPRVRPAAPAAGGGWVKNPIDAFLAARHAEHGLRPQAEAPRHVLVRRIYLDLIGLPPSPDELAALEADASADWYERLVDRLLADPRHGERWGRHWMDVWRYADWWGLGAEHRNSQKHMWHYRDWIVESLNADLPYDEMVRQMLAADELYPLDDAKLRATGFLARNYFIFNRNVWLDETVEHVGKGLLGLTMNCSKCHDHKYDPIQQEDFYRLRAFFEPYQCRVDVLAGEPDLERDGLPRVFDALLDTPTFLFIRGDESQPDTSRPLEPGVPAVFGFRDLAIEPVRLPKAAWQPARRPGVIEAELTRAEQAVTEAEATFAAAIAKRDAEVSRLALADGRPPAGTETRQPATPARPAILSEDFAIDLPGRWRPFGGRWQHQPGQITQQDGTETYSALRLAEPPPRDFEATIRFTLLGGTTYRSVGIGFDVTAEGGEQLVYVSGETGRQKVQGSYRTAGGRWRYPAEAARPISLVGDRPHTLRIAVRDTLVNAWFDEVAVLAWQTPLARRPGSLQLVTFDAAATFHGMTLREFPADLTLDDPARAVASGVELAILDAVVCDRRVEVAKARRDSVAWRAAATRAAWAVEDAGPSGLANPLAAEAREQARRAVRSERQFAVSLARQRLAEAEAARLRAGGDKQVAAAKELDAAKAALAQAEAAVGETGESFSPFRATVWSPTKFRNTQKVDPAPPFPPTSTGRRRALAEWITDPANPLTARVAVNHIWLRHFGRPLVTTVFDFGRKGNRPDHPQLLDWLASDLVDGPPGGSPWSMKHLHRLIVTSAAYRMSSSSLERAAEAKADPDNRFFWRRDQIRLEAEVIRDSLLALAGTLDATRGGPSVQPAEQAASRRRSLYFFHSGVERNVLLKTFDVADVTECYQRDQSIVPQQALALANSALVRDMAAAVTARIGNQVPNEAADAAFLDAAFRLILGRPPAAAEAAACAEAIAAWKALPEMAAQPQAGRENVVWALLNHNDFVVLR